MPVYNKILDAIQPSYSATQKADALRILGLEAGATPEDIKASYNGLARTTHPDKGGDGARFKKVNQANQVLTKPLSYECIEKSQWIANAFAEIVIMTFFRFCPPLCYIFGGNLPFMNPIMIGLLSYDWAVNLSSVVSGFIIAFAWKKSGRFLIPVFLLINPLTAATWVAWAINMVAYLPLCATKYCFGEWGAAIFQFFIDWVVVSPPELALKVVSYWPCYFLSTNLIFLPWNSWVLLRENMTFHARTD